ncbi:MAG: hypothetical protein J7M25_02685 [Deltaproteobacteria bacterium]|nr:hypothetical protein [Deltaproteobacteria bacterium]
MTRVFPLYWIIVPTLIAGLWLLAFGKSMRRASASVIALTGHLASFVFLVWAMVTALVPLLRKWYALPEALRLMAPPHPVVTSHLGAWMALGRFRLPIAFQLDGVGAFFSALTALVGVTSILFAMGAERKTWSAATWNRHVGSASLTIAAIQGFILSPNLGVAVVWWILAGWAAVATIGTSPDSTAPNSAKTSWLVLVFSDLALLLAIITIMSMTHALDLGRLNRFAMVLSIPKHTWIFGLKPSFVVTALVTAAAMARAAQFPLHLWLAEGVVPSGIASPILLGALAPSAIYLVLEMNVVEAHAPVAMAILGLMAGLSSLLLALAAAAQQHIRRAVAYLAAAGLAAALAAAGTGAFFAAMIHALTIGLLAAAMAMAASSVVCATDGVTDLRDLGGLTRVLPWIAGLFLLAVLTISGIYPLSGWFSTTMVQQAALTHIFERTPGIMRLKVGPAAIVAKITFGLLLASSLATAYAALRLWIKTFAPHRQANGPSKSTPEDSRWTITRHPISQTIAVALMAVPGSALILLATWKGLGALRMDHIAASSLPGAMHWIAQDAWRATGTGDLTHVRPNLVLVIHSALGVGLLAALGLALMFFWRRSVSSGRIVTARWYHWFYRFLEKDLGARSMGRLLRGTIVGFGWIERILGERLLSDWLLARLPAGIIAAVGWLTARIQGWARAASVAIAVLGLALLLLLAGGRHKPTKSQGQTSEAIQKQPRPSVGQKTQTPSRPAPAQGRQESSLDPKKTGRHPKDKPVARRTSP